MLNTTSELEIKKQSTLLAKEIENILYKSSVLIGKFIAYFNGNIVIGDSHEECFTKAEKKFGKASFAISEITSKKLLVSSLVKF